MTLLPKIVCPAGGLYDVFPALPNRAVSLTSKGGSRKFKKASCLRMGLGLSLNRQLRSVGPSCCYPSARFLPQ